MSIFETPEFRDLASDVAFQDEGALDRLHSFLWAIGFTPEALAAVESVAARLDGVSPYRDTQARHLREVAARWSDQLDREAAARHRRYKA